MFKSILMSLLAAVVLGLSGCSNNATPTPAGGGDKAPTPATGGGAASTKVPKIAFVTNCVDPFWTIAEKGVQKAGKDFNAEVEMQQPANGQASEQKSILENLVTRGVDGIAITPKDPEGMADILNSTAEKTLLITQDSDAPKSKRLCFIGVDNYTAGRMCGKLVKEAMPEGGKLMIFVGFIEQLNAKQRRQGLIDELMDRNDDPRYDEPDKEIKNDKYTIIDTRADQTDAAKAKSQAEDAIVKYPDLNMMVGLFAYNTPRCLDAVKAAGKLGKIKLVGFDEDAQTLQGIADGNVYGTVVQNPYEYGYQSVKMLAALARGDKSVIPENKYMKIPARMIKKDGVAAFKEELDKLRK